VCPNHSASAIITSTLQSFPKPANHRLHPGTTAGSVHGPMPACETNHHKGIAIKVMIITGYGSHITANQRIIRLANYNIALHKLRTPSGQTLSDGFFSINRVRRRISICRFIVIIMALTGHFLQSFPFRLRN